MSESAQAAASGAPVEVVGERTATDTVYANPSGTFTREIASSPIRVRDADGGWSDIDYSLRVVDGVVKPVAAPGAVALSDGGDDPLISTTTGGVESAVSWPSKLPAPILEGATATYPDVFNDVDLKVLVGEGGVSQILVVHNEEAAQNPALKELALDTEVSDGSMVQKGGGFAVLDETGREVAEAAAPLMWDSSGVVRDDKTRVVPDASDAAVEQRAQGPANGDDVSAIAAEVDSDQLVITPDTDALTGDEVTFPVYIDPTVSPTTPTAWAMVFKQHPTSKFYKWTDSAGQGVGYQNYDGVSTKRLFWQFGIPGVAKSDVIAATFKARMNWSASCTTRAVKIYRVSEVNSSRTWNSQPTWGDYQSSKSVSAGWSGCNPSGVDVVWNVKPALDDAAAESRTAVAFGMRVDNETDPLTWRRFRHTASIAVEYNRAPSTPTSVQVGGKACGGAAQPVLKRTTIAPAMSAIVGDPDKDTVRARFQWGGAGTTVSSTAPETLTSYVTNGARASAPINVSAGPDGSLPSGTWSFRVRGQDPKGLLGAYTAVCTFSIDSTLAPTPTATDTEGRWLLGTGNKKAVEFAPADGQAADTAGYAYTIDNDQAPSVSAQVPTASDKKMLFDVPVPATPGLHTLRLWAYDAAGNPSANPAPDDFMKFEVFDASDSSRSTYLFNEESGTSAADSTGTLPMSIGTAARVIRSVIADDDGNVIRRDRMLRITPDTTTLPSVSGDVVATNRSFSIAALLDPSTDATAGKTAMTAVTIKGSNANWAELGVEPTSDGYAYVFRMWDTTTNSWKTAELAGEDESFGTTLVVASFDIVTGEMTLEMPETGLTPSTASGVIAPTTLTAPTLKLGADTGASNRWNGFIDDVVIARGALSRSEIDELVIQHEQVSECDDLNGGC